MVIRKDQRGSMNPTVLYIILALMIGLAAALSLGPTWLKWTLVAMGGSILLFFLSVTTFINVKDALDNRHIRKLYPISKENLQNKRVKRTALRLLEDEEVAAIEAFHYEGSIDESEYELRTRAVEETRLAVGNPDIRPMYLMHINDIIRKMINKELKTT